jgi:hypothetical protein
MPGWAVPSIKLLGGLAIAHFVLFLVLTGATSPEIKDGQYVLNNHGQITRVLSQRAVFAAERLGVTDVRCVLDLFLYGASSVLVVPERKDR